MIHNEYTQDNPRINQQDRQNITFPGSAYPKEISQQCTPTTHRSSALPGGPLEGLPSLSLTTKGSWMHLWGEGSPSLSSALWCQYRRGATRSATKIRFKSFSFYLSL